MYALRQLETPRHTPWFRDTLPSDEEAASESDQGGFLLGKRVSFEKEPVKNRFSRKEKSPTLLEQNPVKMGLFWKQALRKWGCFGKQT